MKKTMKSAAIGLLTLVASVTTFTASAADAELKAAGKINNQPVFQLDLNNTNNSRFLIVVKDEYGVILHQETISGVNISRRYQLNTEELGGVDVRIEILNINNEKVSVFQIKNNIRVENETSIVKK